MVKRRDFLINASGTTVGLSAFPTQSLASQSPSELGRADSRRISGADTENASTRGFGNVLDPTYIDPRLDSRSISFENPTGARGSGGKEGNGRKRHPFYTLDPGERIMLAEITGAGTIRHFWTMLSGLPPEVARALRLEVFYDGLTEPSVSVPILDFFGLPHGRVTEYYSALISVNNGRGLNSCIPMPFRHSIRMELTNESTQHVGLFYQIDYTLERPISDVPSYLHVAFRRENPTTLLRDFVVTEGLKGPGRLLGCSVGIRVIDEDPWYGEGEVKIYRDGDGKFPTYCGTGLEDYVGSAYGMERHYGPYGGVPINVNAPSPDAIGSVNPKFVGFYRWHLPDPIMFSEEIRVTIQQIGGSKEFKKGQEAAYAAYKAAHIAAGPGWVTYTKPFHDTLGLAIVERRDDYCATAFVYCRKPQPVPRCNIELAVRDIGLLPGEAKEAPVRMSAREEEQLSIELKKYWGRPGKR